MRRRTPWLASFALAVIWAAGGISYLAYQEVPTATIKGKVLAEDTGQPLAEAMVQLHGVSPERGKSGPEIVMYSRADGTLRARRVPAGTYEVEASSDAHSLHRTTFVLAEGEVRDMVLELPPIPPFVDLRMPQHVFLPGEAAQVSAHGFIQEEALEFRLYRVDLRRLFAEQSGNLYWMIYRGAEARGGVPKDTPGLTPAGTFSAPITRRDVEGVFHQRIDLPKLTPGLYVIEAASGSARQLTWVMITRLGMVVKHTGGQALAFVADLKTGAPVAGAHVEFAPAKGAHVTGTTDVDGLYQGRIFTPKTDTEDGESPHITAWAEKEGSQAFLSYSEWGRGGDHSRVYSYTDRPVYRPGHTAFFSGMARTVQEVGYGVPASEPVEVEVRDPQDSLVYRKTLTTDRYGSFHDSFSLSDAAATGDYTLRTRLKGEQTESGFKVAEYRKPEYEVEVKTGKSRYTRGETIDAGVTAQYYFGAPVADAEIKYQVSRSPYYYYPDLEQDSASDYGGDVGDEGDGEYYDSGEVVREGTAHTDEQGVAHISIPTRHSFVLGERTQTTEEEQDQDERYIVSVTLTDVGGREVTGEGTTIVTQGEFALAVQPLSFVATPGTAARIALTTQTYEGKPVPNVRVTVVAQAEKYTAGEVVYGPETKLSGTTEAKGTATVAFTPPKAGYYRLQATAYDRRGNRIRTRNYLWVTSEEYADLGVQYPELEIIPDKREYGKGETASLLINTQYQGGQALLTIEGPRLFSHRLISLKGKSTRVALPIGPEYAPNVYVAVALVRNKHFATQERRLLVSVRDRALAVTVQPNKSRYAPGERATYTLTTRDASGRPVPAAASIGVVDESIYAIQADTTPAISQFFYEPRGNSVNTVSSFPEFYLDANKEPVGIKVRRRFNDTAYWNPTVITDAQGRATVSFTMPEQLTTWRATTRAATLATEVGQSVVKVQTTKDLLVRLETPRFFTQNDRLTIAAVVHSYAKARQDLQLWIRAPGLTFDGAKEPPRADTFSLDPGKAYRREWQIEVPAPGPKEITVYTRAKNGLSDAMALTIPAMPHGREQVESRSGGVTDSAVERFIVRTDAAGGTGELRVRLTPSLAGVMFGALDYLANYPYGCTEQTMSSFLPDVVVSHARQELQLPVTSRGKQLPDMVRAGLDRLYSYQHDDGGWGWWRYDQTDAWMTSYVAYGLLLAKQNGFEVNAGVLDRGLGRLTQYAQPIQPMEAQRQAFVAQVLAMAGHGDAATPIASFLLAKVDRLDSAALARLTATLLALNREADAKTTAGKLWARASETPSLLWWPAAVSTYWGHEGTSSTEITALAFQSLETLTPNDPRLPKAVRWLVLNRRGDCWESTRATASVLFAITGYMKRAQELKPDYQAKVMLGDRVLLDRHITTADVYGPEIEVTVPFSALRRGTNALRLAKAGTGNLYYAAQFTQYIYQEDMTALVSGSGITITRQYFRLRTGRDGSGGFSTYPYPNATTDLRLGESALVRLTVDSPREYEYMVIEDPLPSGAEVQERGYLEPWEWNWWYSDMQVRDEKVSFFARYLPKGRSTVEYYLRPQFPGEYHVMPTVTYNMYAPEIRGTSAEARVRMR